MYLAERGHGLGSLTSSSSSRSHRVSLCISKMSWKCLQVKQRPNLQTDADLFPLNNLPN